MPTQKKEWQTFNKTFNEESPTANNVHKALAD